MVSRLARFVCFVELTEHFPLGDVHALARPLSDHTPLVWVDNEGHGKPMYLKIDRLLLRETSFKEEVERVRQLHRQYGSEIEMLASKIDESRAHLMEFCKHIQKEQN